MKFKIELDADSWSDDSFEKQVAHCAWQSIKHQIQDQVDRAVAAIIEEKTEALLEKIVTEEAEHLIRPTDGWTGSKITIRDEIRRQFLANKGSGAYLRSFKKIVGDEWSKIQEEVKAGARSELQAAIAAILAKQVDAP